MSRELWRYQFMPSDGREIEVHTIMTLASRAEKLGMTEREVQRIVLIKPAKVIEIKDVGRFRRIR